MRMNLHILHDALSEYNPLILASDSPELNLEGIRYLPSREERWSTEYMYAVTTQELISAYYQTDKRSLTFLCQGNVDPSFFDGQRLVRNCYFESSITTRYLTLFKTHSKPTASGRKSYRKQLCPAAPLKPSWTSLPQSSTYQLYLSTVSDGLYFPLGISLLIPG